MPSLLINMSGHPLHPETAKEVLSNGFSKVLDIPVPNIDQTEGGFVEAAKSLVEIVYKKHKKVLATGDFAILPPGLAPLSIGVISLLHGISGHFPTVVFLVRRDSRFAFGGCIDVQSLRNESRNFRI